MRESFLVALFRRDSLVYGSGTAIEVLGWLATARNQQSGDVRYIVGLRLKFSGGSLPPEITCRETSGT